MSARREPLTAIDAAWLRMDQPTNPMVITAVLELEGTVTREEVVALVREKLLPRPRFALRARAPRLPGARARWEVDPHFDVRNHVHAVGLPAPQGHAALEALVSDLSSQRLDRSRPLWDVHVVDGARLDDGSPATVIVTRLHHAIGDGVALVGVLSSLADEGTQRAPPVPGRARSATRGLEAARRAAADAAAFGRIVLLGRDPRTPLRGPLGAIKRVAWSRAVPLAGVRATAARVSGKVNDVLLAACVGALRTELLARGWDGRRDVRALVPVHVPGGRAADGLGNHIGLVFVELPVTLADRAARLLETKAHMDRAKEQPDATVALGVLSAMGIAARDLEQLAVGLFSSKATVLVTNVRGPEEPLHLLGHRVRSMLVWAPVSGGIGLGLTLLSYDGHVRLGVSSDAGLVPDPSGLVRAFERELDAL